MVSNLVSKIWPPLCLEPQSPAPFPSCGLPLKACPAVSSVCLLCALEGMLCFYVRVSPGMRGSTRKVKGFEVNCVTLDMSPQYPKWNGIITRNEWIALCTRGLPHPLICSGGFSYLRPGQSLGSQTSELLNTTCQLAMA